jgi:hypothetical protein
MEKGAPVPDFSELGDEAKKLASEHPEQADQAFDKAADFANQRTGNRFDSEIQRGEQAGENYMGIQDQDQQGQQQSQGQGGQGQGGYDQGQGGGQYGGQYGDQGGQGGGQYGDQGDQGQGGQYGDQGDQGQGSQYGDQGQGSGQY